MLKTIKRIKQWYKAQRNFKKTIIKMFTVFLLFTISIEVVLWGLESNKIINEPYEWSNHVDIPMKINECIELFSLPENKNKIKVVLIGDSRPECSFDPILFDEFNKNKTISYNLAIPGTFLEFHSMYISKVIIPKVKPDIIIWDLHLPHDFSEFANKKNEYLIKSNMGRYYNDDSEGLDFEEKCDFYLFKYSRIFRYKSLFLNDILKLDSLKGRAIEELKKGRTRGQLKRYRVYGVNESMKIVIPDFKIYTKAKTLFTDIVELITKKTSYFLFLTGPYRSETIRSYELELILNNTLKPENFLNLNGNKKFNNGALYEDIYHLNVDGSELYTKYIYNKLIENKGKWIE